MRLFPRPDFSVRVSAIHRHRMGPARPLPGWRLPAAVPKLDLGIGPLLGMQHGSEHRFFRRAGRGPARCGVSVPVRHGESSSALPAPAFSDFHVVSGGIGEGTVVAFQFSGGGRSQEFRQTLTEPEPGRPMVETDANSSSVTTFVVDPIDGGESSKVTISTQWNGARGIGGFFERMLAPRVMRGIYLDQIRRLDEYARSQPWPIRAPTASAPYRSRE